jgi:glycosyltransferase involved in cell wall biosynthesis
MPERIKISIGICAYNEAQNIRRLLLALLSQKEAEIYEIIVISDASIDGTDEEIESVQDQRVKLISLKERRGKPKNQNMIFEAFGGDVLFIIDADSVPSSERFLHDVTMHMKKTGAALLCPLTLPAPAENFFESIINTGAHLRRDLVMRWNNGKNPLACHGVARLFSRNYAKTLRYTGDFGEDTYTYLRCIELNLPTTFLSSCVVYYKSPSTLRDHFRQSYRFKGVKGKMYEYFPKAFVDKEMHIPLGLLAAAVLNSLTKKPLLTCLYLWVAVWIKIIPPRKLSGPWKMSDTTKNFPRHFNPTESTLKS